MWLMTDCRKNKTCQYFFLNPTFCVIGWRNLLQRRATLTEPGTCLRLEITPQILLPAPSVARPGMQPAEVAILFVAAVKDASLDHRPSAFTIVKNIDTPNGSRSRSPSSSGVLPRTGFLPF